MNRIFITSLAGAVLMLAACSKSSNSVGNLALPPPTPPSVSTFAGSGAQGAVDGLRQQAEFNQPTGIAINADGFFFVADRVNELIREISPLGQVVTVAGTPGTSGFSNVVDSVTFNLPSAVAMDPAGDLFIADEGNAAIREITPSGVLTTFAGSKGTYIYTFITPAGLATDAAGNVYVADAGANDIIKITAKGAITKVAGNGTRGALNGAGSSASFNQPLALTVDGVGNIYVADLGNNLIRLINTQGQVSTFAGSGAAGNANGKGTAASFNSPAGIAIDQQGNLYVGDAANNMVRKIAPDGTVTTLAGTGAAGANNGALTTATFNSPQGVAVDTYGHVYVTDTNNSLIRMIFQ